MAGVQTVLTSIIFLLSIRHGEGGLRPTEALMIVLASAGVIGWMVADEPVIATACVVAADLVGAAMLVNGAIMLLILHRRGVLAAQPGNVACASILDMSDMPAGR